MLPLFSMLGGNDIKATVSLTDNSVDTTNLTTYTFSSQTLGTAAANRKIIICVAGNGGNAGAVSSLTVGGISATNVIAVSDGGTVQSEIWVADVPTGTTGDVVVTFSTAKARCGIGVYRAIGSQSTANATASSTADPMSASLFIPYNGIGIGVAQDISTSTYTWTNLTEDYDEIFEVTTTQTGASLNNLSPQTPTITANPSNTAVTPAMALASWSPSN